MSLLKKYGKSKQSNDDSSPRLESPSASKPLFRKSASIDAPNTSGSDVDRPPSQQSGRGNKKKIIPSFLSNLFGGNNNKIPEAEGNEKPQKISSSRSAGGDYIRASRESLNSVLSSSSFSFVNPKSLGGKKVKGKRIPVDDPNYGSTTANNSSSSNKNTEGSKKGFGNTIEKIGARIGLKMKYNLQSCESLQYIDACDDTVVVAAPSVVTASTSKTPTTTNTAIAGNTTATEAVKASTRPNKVNMAESQGQTSSGVSNSAIDVEQIDPALKFAVIKSSKIALKSHASKYNAQKKEREDISVINRSQNEKDALSVKIVENEAEDPKRKGPFKVESSAQTVVQSTVLQPKIVEKSFFVTPSTAQLIPFSKEEPNVEKKENTESKTKGKKESVTPVVVTPVPEPVAPSAKKDDKIESKQSSISQPAASSLFIKDDKNGSVAPSTTSVLEPAAKVEKDDKAQSVSPASVSSEPKPKIVSPPVIPIVLNQSSKSEPEPIPSTSTSTSTPAQDSITPSPAIPSTSKAMLSNTWGNSGRRKRKAPQPPSGNENAVKLYNGTSSNDQTKIVTDLANDVPTSSSSAAVLTKFKRIQESPPPPQSMKPSTGTFEIRPRKKERSVEPMPCVRPTSSFATPTASASNTLFSPHHSRYQQHKRSNSDGEQTPNTNTKGRVHKAGKKKAPPPPNPFGDPDNPQEQGESTNDKVAVTVSNSAVPTTSAAVVTTSITKTRDSPSIDSKSVEAQRTNNVSSSGIAKSKAISRTQSRPSPNPFEEDSERDAVPPSTPPPISPKTPPHTSTSTFTTFEISTSTPATSSGISSTHPATSTSFAPTNDLLPTVVDDSNEIDEETRQNMLNDQQERQQQLGLANAPASEVPEIPTAVPAMEVIPSVVTDIVPTRTESSITQAPSTSLVTTTSTASVWPSTSSPPITENDVRAAHHNLEVLSTSIRNSSQQQQPQTTPASDPTVKAKLLELKKEAETSPLNASKNKSRPLSIGSAIYDSLMGKSTSTSTATPHAGTKSGDPEPASVSSPKVPHKPWYKNLPPYKSRHPPQIKPFTSLVKFSELDKEAARIVEENKRKSAADEKFLENAQDELDEIFAGISDDEVSNRTSNVDNNEVRSKPEKSNTTGVSSPVKVFTTAEVHPITSENANRAVAGCCSSTAPQESTTNGNSTSPSTSKKDGSSSPPTFQSVHAASKHRQIKPLLSSSPVTNLRSEKLAIVQPQTSAKKTETKKVGESSSVTVAPISSTSASTSAPTTTVSSSQSSITSSVTSSTPTQSSTQVSSTATTPTSAVATTAITRASTGDNDWDCPRCTLKNPNWRSLCEACYYRKDPVSSFSSGFISSIFQRVNAESNKIASGSNSTSKDESGRVTSSNSTTEATSSSTSTTCIPSSSSVITTTATSTATSTTTTPSSSGANSIPTPQQPSTSKSNASSQTVKSNGGENEKKKTTSEKKSVDIPPQAPPPCENFLSQLPTKQDLSKEEKLHGIKLHEDPELEELDIGKLREARLAYFQRRQSSDSIEANSPFEEVTNADTHMQTNDLGSATSAQDRSSAKSEKTNNNTTNKRNSNSFADNEDDFIDHLLQLDATSNRSQQQHHHQNEEDDNDDNNIPTTIANIVDPTPNPPPPEEEEDNTATPQIPQLQNRFKPRLEAIREGSSQDYTYCYSPSEIAQIYENWQTSQSQVPKCDNKNLQVGPSSLSPHCSNIAPSGSGSAPVFPFLSQYAPHLQSPQQTHLFGTSQHQQPPPLMLHHLHEALLHNNNSGSLQRASPHTMFMGPHTIPSSVLMMTVDHQPYANNRLLDNSPEENYMNTATTTTVHAPLIEHPTLCAPALNLNTPTLLNESANFSRNISPIPTLRLSPFPSVAVGQRQSVHLAVTATDNNNINNISQATNQNQFLAQPPFFSYENSMSLNSSGESSRKLSYEDYQRMGAIPKGFSFPVGQNDEWSSESSGETDSSRGFWGRRGYMDSLPGLSRRSGMDFTPEMTVPDQTMAVAKLMKRLEAAIANGDHRLAATLAHDLALMKVNCVVAKINQPFSIRVYVEDRFMQQGPFVVQVSSMMTVRDLKAKIENDWGIPAGFQKWILGQKMAEDDNQSLSSFDMQRDSMAFLFLVTPDMGKVPTQNGKMAKVNSKGVSGSVEPNMNSATGSVKGPSSSVPAPIIDPVTMHAYECVDERPVYNNLDNVRPTKSASKKTSTSAQTSNQVPTHAKEGKLLAPGDEETSPPPLPSRSPIPSTQFKPQVKQQNTSLTGKQSLASASESKPSPNVGKDVSMKNVPQSVSDTLSAASALTLSLQQKLAEFKAVAEQTFGKTRDPSPSRPGTKLVVKEPSPGPSSKILNIRSSSESPNLRRSSESKATKSFTKKSGKSQLTPTSSKEKLTNASSGSTEKLHPKSNQSKKVASQERPISPENRFNGILLPTSEDGKPPERPEKSKKITNDSQRATSPATTTSPGPSNITGSENAKKPPVPPTAHSSSQTQTSQAAGVSQAITKPSNQVVDSATKQDEAASAPQPTPRGIKRQITSPEKISKEVESSKEIVQEEAAVERPTPTPRTNLKLETGVTRDTQRSPTPKQVNSQPQTSTVENASINEYCQTTLPFPAPRSRITGGNDTSPTFPVTTFAASVSSSVSQTETASKGLLLRPSAFVMQLKTENSQQTNNSNPETPTAASASSPGVFHSALTGNLSSSNNTPASALLTSYFSSTVSTFSQSGNSKINNSSNGASPNIAVAHVQPLSVSTKTTTPPTAYVAPSPSLASSTSASTSSTVTAPKTEDSSKKQDDSAQSYLKMMEMMERQDLIFTMEDAECPVCFASLPKGEGIILRDCLHVFCRECLVGCVQYADDSTVKCPYRDNDYACNNNLQEREIKALVPSEIFEKYLARSVKLAESKIVNTFHCKTPDCTGWCVFEDDVNTFFCPVCKKRNCLTCAAIHEGMDCQKYQRELAIAAETDEDAKQSRLMLEKMIQRGEALDCPACHVVLLKKWGCDWVRCSYCKTEICWVTKGFRWGKGGKGDISGGCKCGVNGVKCHPKCTYCH